MGLVTLATSGPAPHVESRVPADEQVLEAASLWLERLERTLKAGEAESFREWLQTPLHRKVIVRRCMTWHGPEVLAVLGTIIPEAVEDAIVSPRERRFAPVLSWIVAACVVGFSTYVLLGGPAWVVLRFEKQIPRIQEFYRAPADERRVIDLPDGARITLNAAATVFVNYGPSMRDAALLKGEALFDVPRYGARSFTLTAGARVIETPVARFNLRRLGSGGSEITVLKGEVTVLRPLSGADRTPAQLRDTVSYTYGEAVLREAEGGMIAPEWQLVRRLTGDERQARLAWQAESATR